MAETAKRGIKQQMAELMARVDGNNQLAYDEIRKQAERYRWTYGRWDRVLDQLLARGVIIFEGASANVEDEQLAENVPDTVIHFVYAVQCHAPKALHRLQ